MSLAVPTVCLALGARYACEPCALRTNAAEACPRCAGALADLESAEGRAVLARVARARRRAARAGARTRGVGDWVYRAAALGFAVGGAVLGARYGKRFETHGIVSHEVMAAAGAAVGFVGGALVAPALAALALALAAGAAGATSVLAGLVAGVAWTCARAAGARGRAFREGIWPRFASVVRGAWAPVRWLRGGRAGARAVRGLLLVRAPVEQRGRVLEGVVLDASDEVAPGGGRARVLAGVEGDGRAGMIADARAAERIVVRADDGAAVGLELRAGEVWLADDADTREADAREVDANAWEELLGGGAVRARRGWVLGAGARVRVEGGELREDGVLAGSAARPVRVTVLRARAASDEGGASEEAGAAEA